MRKYNILIVDDEEDNLKFLERTLRRKFNISKASNALEGLAVIEKEDIDLVISDFRMPEMDGIEFLSKVKDIKPSAMRILLTAYSEADILIDAINAGGIYRYIKKPCDPENIMNIVDSAIEVYQLNMDNQELTKDFNNLFSGTIKAITEALDAKDSFTYGRSRRVTNLGLATGKKLGLPESELIKLEIAGLLHDIGMIGVPEDVLKKEGKLTAEEYEEIKKHVEHGINILSEIKYLRPVLDIIKYHHERVDGKGYPYGLKGDEIPISAKIITVADAYDGMISDRAYRKSLSSEEAVEEIKKLAGSQFDKKVVNAFVEVIKNLGL